MVVRRVSEETAAGRERGRPRKQRAKPSRLRSLPPAAWGRIAKRTFDQFRADGVTNLSAALTFRSVLSVFPALLALVALLGVLGQYPKTFNAILQIVGGFAPRSTVQTVSGPVREVIADKGGAGAVLGVGFAGAVWAASGYIGAFSWAANVIWEAPRGRSWYRQWPFNYAVTVVVLAVGTLIFVALAATGPVARSIGRQLGIGSTAIDIWNYAKWPALVVVVVTVIDWLYYIAPNVRPPSWRWLTPGALLAVTAWFATSLGFGYYVANFGSYNKTYGTLGAIVVFLLWLWLTNIALLLGIELNSEIERERQLRIPEPEAAERIQLPLRQS
jgi:membrane protein